MPTDVCQAVPSLGKCSCPRIRGRNWRAWKQVGESLREAFDLCWQQLVAERSAKTIYVHSHMDEASFDTDRVRQCCVGVPSADGGNVPTCSYNILYRERDPRFSALTHKPLAEFAGGRSLWRP